MSDRYVVAVKPSARRASAAVGEWVAERGRHRTFDSKPLAREWATDASPPGRTLWIQDAHPRDDGLADGYLLARRSRLSDTRTELPGVQQSLSTL